MAMANGNGAKSAEDANDSEIVLSVRDVTVAFDDKVILDKLSLDIKRGERRMLPVGQPLGIADQAGAARMFADADKDTLPRRPLPNDPPGDFDFLVGSWKVRHRRLKERLMGSTEWEEFDGTCTMRPLLGGYGNVDDNVLHLPGGSYRGVGLRS